MTRKKRLGRGLEALLNATRDPDPASEDSAEILPFPAEGSSPAGDDRDDADAGDSRRNDGLVYLNVFEIDDNPFQPRRDFSAAEIGSLAESLKTHDMLQPILVRIVEGRHQLISGERRLRAAIQAGWTTVPARIRQADDRLVAELAIVENLQRKDLNPIEKAWSFKRYLNEHQATQEELAERLKIDRSTIANLMRLLELPTVVQECLKSGAITAGHARALLPLGDEPLQVDYCQKIQREGMSVRQIEQLVASTVDSLDQPGTKAKAPRRRAKSQQIEALERQLKSILGARVDIRQSSTGRGKIVVHFGSREEFERLHRFLLDLSPPARAA